MDFNKGCHKDGNVLKINVNEKYQQNPTFHQNLNVYFFYLSSECFLNIPANFENKIANNMHVTNLKRLSKDVLLDKIHMCAYCIGDDQSSAKINAYFKNPIRFYAVNILEYQRTTRRTWFRILPKQFSNIFYLSSSHENE